jgi:hypothetical protein
MCMMNRNVFLTSAMALLIGACATSPQHEPVEKSPVAAPIALSDYLQVLQTIDIEVGGHSLPFLFDTAGGATLFTPMLAEAIGCKPFGRVTAFRHDGSRIDVPRCGAADLHIGDLPLRAEAGVFDLMALMPEGAPKLGGIVSLQTLGTRPWTLDMSGRTLTLETPASLAQRTAGMREIQVRPSTQGGGAGFDLFMKVDAPQGDLWLEIDSGNAAGLILSPHALTQLGIEKPQDASATVPVALQISGFGTYAAPALIKDTIYDGLLDARFLKAHRLSVDPATGKAWLQSTVAP